MIERRELATRSRVMLGSKQRNRTQLQLDCLVKMEKKGAKTERKITKHNKKNTKNETQNSVF